MIDISSKVFDTVYTAVTTTDPNADVTDVPAERFAKFPAVVVRETNNAPVRRTDTDDNSENYSRIDYEIRIYADDETGAKAKADQLMQSADAAMKGLKFRRTMCHRLPNQDRTIYCVYGRYSVIVRAPFESGEDTVYQMYRG